MEYKVVFRPVAESDLTEIYHFIYEHNPAAAIAIVRRVRSQCLTLAAMPDRGPPRERLGAGIRLMILERRVTIAYRVTAERIDIMRVFYAGQNIPEKLSDP